VSNEKLPKVADSHVQSADSDVALRQVIRMPLFIIRESKPDYGVDYVAEVMTDERDATNWHLQIQLRSENPPRFVDGGAAISVRFETSALNYLFRWPGRSIVVAYDAAGGQLYWEWTERIVAALDSSERDWRNQETVTVRVPTSNRLAFESADGIRGEVLNYHRRAAAVQKAALVGGSETTATAESLSRAGDIVSAVRDGGAGLVSHGLHREVLALLQQVPEAKWVNDLRVVLTVAFAYERSSSPLQALYYASLIPDDAPGLDDEDLALVQHIRLNAQLALGQISAETHWNELRALARRFPSSLVAAQALLVALAADVVLAPREKREEAVLSILGRARALVAAHASETTKNVRSRWALDVLLAHVEMEVLDQLLISGSHRVQIAQSLGVPIPLRERVAMAQATAEVAEAASSRLEAITRQAHEAGAVEWEAIARITFLEAHVKRFALLVALGGDTPTELEEQGQRLTKEAAMTAESLAAQLVAADHRMLAFRAKRLQGDALVMLGDDSGAAAVRRDFSPDFPDDRLGA
jgi:hypothetical protein